MMAARNVHSSSLTRALSWVVLGMAFALVIGPLALIVLTSFKTNPEIFSNPLALPTAFGGQNYLRAWQQGGIPSKALNSLLVTLGSVSIAIATGAGAGYVAARIRPRWLGRLVTALFAFGLFIPVQSGIALIFVEMGQLGLIGTLWPMILINAATQLPITVVLFSAFFEALPEEIEESAFLDGAGRVRTLISIVLPISTPVVVTSIILGVVAVWNDYFVALVFATDPSIRTLPVGLAAFSGQYGTDWGASLAFSVIVAAPLIALYIVLQRYILDGVTAGAVRG